MAACNYIKNFIAASHRGRSVRRSTQGFTLVETILTLAIMVLLTGIVAMGLPSAWRTYTHAVNYSNAQILLSTASSELRNTLGLAQEAVVGAGNSVEYFLSGDGYWEKLSVNDGVIKGRVYYASEFDELQKIAGSGKEDDLSDEFNLVNTRARDSMKIHYDNITYENGAFTVNNLLVYESSSDKNHPVVSLPEFKILAFSLDNNVRA